MSSPPFFGDDKLNKTQEALKMAISAKFTYAQDGNLIYKVSTSPRVSIGAIAGTIKSNGYKNIKVDGKVYLAHRLVFLLHHGYLPEYIDHIDGDRLNNRIENLREATKSQNQWNVGKRSHNTSGVQNVNWHEQAQKWCVRFRKHNKYVYRKLFKTLEEAKIAADKVRQELFGEFARSEK